MASIKAHLTPTSPEIQQFMQRAAADLGVSNLPAPKDIFAFGSEIPRVTEELNALAFKGIKRATTSYPIPTPVHWSVGDLSVGLDGDGKPAFLMRTTMLEEIDFHSVGEEFAREEGEGDGSLKYWKETHIGWWGRETKDFGDGVERKVLCEKFEIIWPLEVEENVKRVKEAVAKDK